MFGRLRGYFLKNDKSSLDLYHCVYCGSCYALSDKYGALGRLILSYEFTASLALAQAITHSEVHSVPITCPLKGFGKRNRSLFKGQQVDDLTALYIFLLSLKLRDDDEDEGWLRRIPGSVFKRVFCGEFHTIEERLSEFDLDSSSMKSIVSARNQERHDWLDESLVKSGQLFSEAGRVIAKIAGRHDLEDSVSQFGTSLGMCIDLIDMMEDLKSDYSQGRYNPIAHIYGKNCTNAKEIFQNAKSDLEYLSKQLSCDLAIALKSIEFTRDCELIRGIFGRSVEIAFAKALGAKHQECRKIMEASA